MTKDRSRRAWSSGRSSRKLDDRRASPQAAAIPIVCHPSIHHPSASTARCDVLYSRARFKLRTCGRARTFLSWGCGEISSYLVWVVRAAVPPLARDDCELVGCNTVVCSQFAVRSRKLIRFAICSHGASCVQCVPAQRSQPMHARSPSTIPLSVVRAEVDECGCNG